MNKAITKKFEELTEGDSAQFEVVVTPQMVTAFAELSGDLNPLHTDTKYSSQTPFDRPIAHGMICGALFSRLVGMHLPGLYSVYLAQTIAFHKALYPGTNITISGTIVQKVQALNTVKMVMSVMGTLDGHKYVTGEAVVKLLK